MIFAPKLAPAIVFAIVMVPTAIAAQEPEITPEDKERLATLNAFLANAEEFLPTVNLYELDSGPHTFSYRDVLSHVVVDVSFGDGTVLPFMFDTGAPTIVSDALAEKHGGDALVEMATIAGGGMISWSPLLLVPEATVFGTVPIKNMTVQSGWTAPGGLHCISPHGLFGAPALRNAVWQVDYGAHDVTVAASVDQLDHIDGAFEVPFHIKPGTLSPSPQVMLEIGGKELEFLVDTGGGIPLTINSADFAEAGFEIPQGAPVTKNLAAGAAGEFESNLTSVQLPVKLGDTEVMTTVFVGDGMAPLTAGNMGHLFLQNFVVTFDWSTETMYLDPLADDGSIPVFSDVPAAGVGPQPDGSIKVTSLAVGGHADTEGLKLGTTVAAINGVDVTAVGIDQYCALAEAGIKTITTDAGVVYDVSKIPGFLLKN